MSIEIEATYENGSLKLDRALPLEEHQRVKVTIDTEATNSRLTYGIIGWQGDPEVLRRIALDPEHSVGECP